MLVPDIKAAELVFYLVYHLYVEIEVDIVYI